MKKNKKNDLPEITEDDIKSIMPGPGRYDFISDEEIESLLDGMKEISKEERKEETMEELRKKYGLSDTIEDKVREVEDELLEGWSYNNYPAKKGEVLNLIKEYQGILNVTNKLEDIESLDLLEWYAGALLIGVDRATEGKFGKFFPAEPLAVLGRDGLDEMIDKLTNVKALLRDAALSLAEIESNLKTYVRQIEE